MHAGRLTPFTSTQNSRSNLTASRAVPRDAPAQASLSGAPARCRFLSQARPQSEQRFHVRAGTAHARRCCGHPRSGGGGYRASARRRRNRQPQHLGGDRVDGTRAARSVPGHPQPQPARPTTPAGTGRCRSRCCHLDWTGHAADSSQKPVGSGRCRFRGSCPARTATGHPDARRTLLRPRQRPPSADARRQSRGAPSTWRPRDCERPGTDSARACAGHPRVADHGHQSQRHGLRRDRHRRRRTAIRAPGC